ncbi:ATP-binding protein [Lysobacter soli]|uniref:ATP-binding protein n=1 Tax=Lysobacter soli TaxID=453783 RepID=UPI00240EFA9C|nr:ATP-binding protein [Lysobacter soli]MDG2517382.1 AAA family ATPase [Lysobacter soli]
MYGYNSDQLQLDDFPFPGVTFLVGPNGSGKTRLLRRIALHRSKRNHATRIICNTPFDRYAGIRGSVVRLSARSGASQPAEVLKKAILQAHEDRNSSVGRLRSILDYSGYDSAVEVRHVGVDANRIRHVGAAAFELGVGAEVDRIDAIAHYILEHPNNSDWVHLDGDFGKHVFSGPTLDMLRWEPVLRRARFIKRIDLKLVRKHDGMVIPMKDGSSGELTLIAALAFLISHMDHECSILIDEPENSLHPAWQRSYIDRILAVTSLWRPEIIVATHSPLIVSGAQVLDNVMTRVYRVDEGQTRRINVDGDGMEETLWDMFDTITPSNHFLSVKLVEIINGVKRHRGYREAALQEIGRLEEAAYSSDQVRLFQAARNLVRQLAEGRE